MQSRGRLLHDNQGHDLCPSFSKLPCQLKSNVADAIQQHQSKIPPCRRWALYWKALRVFFLGNVSKPELDAIVIYCLGPHRVDVHNCLTRDLLRRVLQRECSDCSPSPEPAILSASCSAPSSVPGQDAEACGLATCSDSNGSNHCEEEGRVAEGIRTKCQLALGADSSVWDVWAAQQEEGSEERKREHKRRRLDVNYIQTKAAMDERYQSHTNQSGAVSKLRSFTLHAAKVEPGAEVEGSERLDETAQCTMNGGIKVLGDTSRRRNKSLESEAGRIPGEEGGGEDGALLYTDTFSLPSPLMVYYLMRQTCQKVTESHVRSANQPGMEGVYQKRQTAPLISKQAVQALHCGAQEFARCCLRQCIELKQLQGKCREGVGEQKMSVMPCIKSEKDEDAAERSSTNGSALWGNLATITDGRLHDGGQSEGSSRHTCKSIGPGKVEPADREVSSDNEIDVGTVIRLLQSKDSWLRKLDVTRSLLLQWSVSAGR